MKSLPAARRESATTTLKKGRFLAPPRERRITTMMNDRSLEKGVILRELRCDWQGSSELRPSDILEKRKQNPAKGMPRAGLEGNRRCGSAATVVSSYWVKNTAIPPLGNPTPPAVAEGPLV